jgi:hypothetical protein
MSVAARTVGGQRHFLAGEQQDVDVGVDEDLKVHPAGLRTEPSFAACPVATRSYRPGPVDGLEPRAPETIGSSHPQVRLKAPGRIEPR